MAITKEQLSKRSGYLGGSDFNYIMQPNKFKSIEDFLKEKVTGSTFNGNVYTLIGDRYEDDIRLLTNELTGNAYKNVDKISYNKKIDDIPFSGHVDGFSFKLNEVLEIKITSALPRDTAIEYYYQTQVYMYLTNTQSCVLAHMRRKESKIAMLTSRLIEGLRLPFLHSFRDDEHKKRAQEMADYYFEDYEVSQDKESFKMLRIDRDDEVIEKVLKNAQIFWEAMQQYIETEDVDFKALEKVLHEGGKELARKKIDEAIKKSREEGGVINVNRSTRTN